MSTALRTYMSHAILVSLAEHKGEDFDHLVAPFLDARGALTEHERRIADARAAHAVEQLLRNAAPPPQAHLDDGFAALEADSYGAELVSIYREWLRSWDAPRSPWVAAISKRAAERKKERAAKATRAKAERPEGSPSMPPPVLPSQITT